MSTFYVPSTPPPRGRAYSFGQSPYPYQGTPYSGYNALPTSYYGTPGVSRSATYYVAPSVVSGRGRSHSRTRRSHSHHRSHGHHHGHHRRSHSATPRHRSHGHHSTYRYQTGATPSRSNYYRPPPSLGERILSFFGLGNSSRYVDQYGRSVDSRGRPKYK